MSRTVTIKIIDDRSQNTEPSALANTQEGISPDTNKNKKDKDKKQSPAVTISAFIAQNVVGTIRAQAEYYGTKYLAMTENYGWQTNIENAKQTIGMINSMASSAIQGYSMGAMINPAVGAIMAVVSTVVNAGRQTVSAINNVEGQNEQIHQYAYSNYFNSVRVGYVDGNRGTEN